MIEHLSTLSFSDLQSYTGNIGVRSGGRCRHRMNQRNQRREKETEKRERLGKKGRRARRIREKGEKKSGSNYHKLQWSGQPFELQFLTPTYVTDRKIGHFLRIITAEPLIENTSLDFLVKFKLNSCIKSALVLPYVLWYHKSYCQSCNLPVELILFFFFLHFLFSQF